MLAAINYMEPESISDKRTLIIGLGATGLSCARFLSRFDIDIAVTDSREQPPALAQLQEELPDVALFMGGFDEQAFARAERIVVSPGVSLLEPLIMDAKRRDVEVVGDIELFACCTSAPVVAITGSNGKSTVTTLVGLMASEMGKDVRVGGNLGTPALDLIDDCEPDLYVLELSSFQLETTHSLRCVASSVLNISPDHLDRYESLEDYICAKQQVYNGAAVQIINRQDKSAAALASVSAAIIEFGLDEPADGHFGLRKIKSEEWLAQGSTNLMLVSELGISGKHNVANALAALALGTAAGLSLPEMLRTLRNFHGLEHRSQWVGEFDGVTWINDSKATNVGATVAAIQGYTVPLILIAGGQSKGADFNDLTTVIDDYVKLVILLGESVEDISAALPCNTMVERAIDMMQAVSIAADVAQPGDIVLLSPACASFDMFDGYAHRGEVFMRAVRELKS